MRKTRKDRVTMSTEVTKLILQALQNINERLEDIQLRLITIGAYRIPATRLEQTEVVTPEPLKNFRCKQVGDMYEWRARIRYMLPGLGILLDEHLCQEPGVTSDMCLESDGGARVVVNVTNPDFFNDEPVLPRDVIRILNTAVYPALTDSEHGWVPCSCN